MKPKPKSKTPKEPIRLTKDDNLLIGVILHNNKQATRTEAVRMGLILAAQQYGNVNCLIMPAIKKKIRKEKLEESKKDKK